MQRYEYRVVPAPRRGEKVRGVKTTEDRFAHALTRLMNDLAREGWEYVRADTLPCDERSGFTGIKTTSQNMLVFRRSIAEVIAEQGSNAEPASAFSRLRTQPDADGPVLKIGSATGSAGPARPLGPANQDVAAE
jgi:hypothetical protein